MSLDALVLWAGTFHLPLTTLQARIGVGLLRARCTCRQDEGGIVHKVNSEKCVCFAGRCLLDTLMGARTELHSH